MAFDPDRLLKELPIETIAEHTVRDVILYALGVGVGMDAPAHRDTLRFVYEQGIQVLPTMVSVLATPGFWARDPRYGIDWNKIVHGEQSLTLHQPVPIEGKLLSRFFIEDIHDKGADKGAVLYSRREIYLHDSGGHIATERKATFLRGDGGKGGRSGGAPQMRPVPDRPCDLQVSVSTRLDQALLYRLSGDYNPLHIDPEIARQAGFVRPILHGLCTYGLVGRALLMGLVGADASRLKSMSCRFSAPVYPGETIVTEIWKLGGGQAGFQSRVAERGILVLARGLVGYAEA